MNAEMDKLLADMKAAERGATCPMCGKAFPHEHNPEEIIIFNNGRKFENRSASNRELVRALEWIAERYDDSKPTYEVAADAYDMACEARAALTKLKSGFNPKS